MIKELSYQDSQEYLAKFQQEEKSYSIDWYDCDDTGAEYIWWLDIEKPLGFLSYKKMILKNRIDFIYIVKIYILNTHRGDEPILIEGERVSIILFKELNSKGVNILTLESSCENLDVYYKGLGFKYIKEISEEFSQVIGTKEKILFRRKETPLSGVESDIFGRLYE